MKTIPIILAGGIGERFWPMSRSSSPKQLHAIGSDKSMLEETVLRMRACSSGGVKPMLITGAGIAGKAAAAIGNPENIEIIAEPIGKNTAPAIALAAAIIQKRHGDAVMAIAPADHAIKPAEDFAIAVQCAVSVAISRGGLVVFGIKPSRPETGYGYIELGEQILSSTNNADNTLIDSISANNISINNTSIHPSIINKNTSSNNMNAAAFAVKRFVEKPDAENAARFMESGRFLWNSGMFVWKASAILSEFRLNMPELHDQAMAAASKDFSAEAINEFYSVCRKESIDFGIMEKAERVSAVRGNFFWDDLGSWESLSRVYGNDGKGTTAAGPLVYENDCADSLIINKAAGRTLAAIGLTNVAIISVDDAILAIDRSRLPDLKKYLAEIKGSGEFPAELF
jgi:mannose-1-phosphate guanylyltransferase